MSTGLIPVPVFVEDSGETLTLMLPPQDAARAATDVDYMTNLVNAVYKKKSQDLIKRANAHISIDDNNDEIDNLVITQSPNSASYTSTSEPQESDDDNKDIGNEKSLFIWPSKCVYLLLEKYEEREGEFAAGVKRHNKIWEVIADDIRKMNSEYTMTGPQCQSKLNGLKKTYKKILDHNSVSGNDRKTWPYFTRMHEIFGKSGWANPKAIASEAGPSNEQIILSKSFPKSDEHSTGKPKKRKIETIMDNFISDIKEERAEREKKMQAKATWFHDLKDQRERQHQERMQMMQKLLEAITKK